MAVVGLAVLLYAGLSYGDLVPGDEPSVPVPPALARAGAGAREIHLPDPTPGVAPTPATVVSAARARESSAPAPQTPLRAGRAVWLEIPSIGLETEVVQGGRARAASGAWVWETAPFVAMHYSRDTALVGDPSNAVIAGHVSTLHEGNVFRELYRVDLGDTVAVTTDTGGLFRYEVARLRLVAPSAVDVLNPTTEPTLTLLTCGGTFDRATRTFSDRLVVSARLVSAEPASPPAASDR